MPHECGHSDDQHDAQLIHLRDQTSAVIRNWVAALCDEHRYPLPDVADLVAFFMASDTMWASDDPQVLALAAKLDHIGVQQLATLAAALATSCGHTEYTYFAEQAERGATAQGFMVASLFVSPNVPDDMLAMIGWVSRRLDAQEIAILGDMVSGSALALRYGADEFRALLK